MSAILFSFFMFGCTKASHKRIGVIDIIDNGICSIQFDDDTSILVKVSKCKNLKEGDTIKLDVSSKGE